MPKKLKRKEYAHYRTVLELKGIKSFIDHSGRTFTSCSECAANDCERKDGVGCMKGELKPEILEHIKKGRE